MDTPWYPFPLLYSVVLVMLMVEFAIHYQVCFTQVFLYYVLTYTYAMLLIKTRNTKTSHLSYIAQSTYKLNQMSWGMYKLNHRHVTL